MDKRDLKHPQRSFDPDRIASADIPQANLPHIHRLLHAMHAGAQTQAEIMAHADFSRRHTHYRLQAARTLALVEPAAGGFCLTELGEQLAKLAPGSPQAAPLWRTAITASAPLQRLAPDLLAEQGPSHDELTARITAMSDLSSATARRRARELINWRVMLTEPAEEDPS